MNYLKKSRMAKYACFGTFTVILIICLINTSDKKRAVVYESIINNYTPDQLALGIDLDRVTACLQKFTSEKLDKRIYEENEDSKKKIQHSEILSNYNHIMASLSIKTAIIEPSTLYCMLIPTHKHLLSKHGFNETQFRSSNNIVTYGIYEDIAKLQEETSINAFRQAGFQPHFVQRTAPDWMLEDGKHLDEKVCSHVFYKYYEFTIHVVVFYNRSTFMWHTDLDTGDKLNTPPINDLFFVDHPSAYEKFTFVQLPTRDTEIYIPSNPAHFLFQIPSSHFLECNSSRTDNVKYSNGLSTSHSSLSVEEFNNSTRVAIRSLKTLLYPLFMNFWIFSGTLLGWYRECDVIPYTSDADFASWASEIEDLNTILNLTLNNRDFSLNLRMGVIDEALELRMLAGKLQVDLFFLYQINNGSWASGHRPRRGYYFRYYYPPFTLCSAELLDEKVQVPCEAENVIVEEYGNEWMKPVSSWNYESSIKNRGPNIYWSKAKRNQTYQEY